MSPAFHELCLTHTEQSIANMEKPYNACVKTVPACSAIAADHGANQIAGKQATTTLPPSSLAHPRDTSDTWCT